jgi:hypothetical protein
MPIRPENKARYPADWKLRSRFVRLVRAQNRCEWCRAENGKPHPVTGSKVVLTAAHVFDHRPEAASLLNLAALCQKCHNAHDAKMRSIGRKQRSQRSRNSRKDEQ